MIIENEQEIIVDLKENPLYQQYKQQFSENENSDEEEVDMEVVSFNNSSNHDEIQLKMQFTDLLAESDNILAKNSYKSYVDIHEKVSKQNQIKEEFAHKNPRFAYHNKETMQKVKCAAKCMKQNY